MTTANWHPNLAADFQINHKHHRQPAQAFSHRHRHRHRHTRPAATTSYSHRCAYAYTPPSRCTALHHTKSNSSTLLKPFPKYKSSLGSTNGLARLLPVWACGPPPKRSLFGNLTSKSHSHWVNASFYFYFLPCLWAFAYGKVMFCSYIYSMGCSQF